MRQRILLLALLAVICCGCDTYFVPDNFPKTDFYSYAPYQEGETITFSTADRQTQEWTVVSVTEEYNRAKRGTKGGKEYAAKIIVFQKNDETLTLYVTCTDRAYFDICLQATSIYDLDGKYIVDYGKEEDTWAKSYDETKIFKEFADEITLYQYETPAALIKKGEGLIWFTTFNNGETWNVAK